MPKAKAPKEGKNSKSHLKARLEYMDHAARYMYNCALPTSTSRANKCSSIDDIKPHSVEGRMDTTPDGLIQPPKLGSSISLSRLYASQMRGASLKTLTRLPVSVKRSFCKCCDTLLIPGESCSQEIRNSSRGGKKPWADVLEIRCFHCGTVRRFPQGDKRSKKLAVRQKEQKEMKAEDQTALSANENQEPNQP